jgi:hypothetical protein
MPCRPHAIILVSIIQQQTSPELKHHSDIDNTVEVMLVGIKRFLYMPLDCIDSQCAIPATESMEDDPDDDIIFAVEVNEDGPLEVIPSPEGVTVQDRLVETAPAPEASTAAPSVPRRRRRIYRI